MKYRNPKKDSDLFSMIDRQREITQTQDFLEDFIGTG
jgi:hypothetical protein